MTKSECRNYFTEKRKKLSPTAIINLSNHIFNQLVNKVKLNNSTISLFLPIEAKKEIDTSIFLRRAKEFNISFGIPVANFDSKTMIHYKYENSDQISISNYGIPEPTYGEIIQPEDFDIVIVPLLCCDKKGYRVGYGKGFYDRFLATCNKNCRFIGVSYFEPIDVISDISNDDVPLHMCITPLSIHPFKTNQ